MDKPNQAISTCKNCGNCKKNQSCSFMVGDWVEPVAKGSAFKAMELTAVYDSHMEAGNLQLNYGHWIKVDKNTDSCTDIKNHISPNTKVIEK